MSWLIDNKYYGFCCRAYVGRLNIKMHYAFFPTQCLGLVHSLYFYVQQTKNTTQNYKAQYCNCTPAIHAYMVSDVESLFCTKACSISGWWGKVNSRFIVMATNDAHLSCSEAGHVHDEIRTAYWPGSSLENVIHSEIFVLSVWIVSGVLM